MKSKKSTNKPITIQSLIKWNKSMAVLHAVQALAVIALSKAVTWPITTTFLSQDTLASEIAGKPILAMGTRTIFSINLGYVVASFFIVSAIAHTIIATVYRKTYESDLKKGINKARWIEYGISASIMMVAIGLLSGISDLSTIVAIFALDLIMNLMGLAMELQNQGEKKVKWFTYKVGCLAGIVPWIIFAIYVTGSNVYGSGDIPTFVYFIFVSLFLLFNTFAINMYLQYKKIGKWSNYLYGERTYMILSLVAKSLLAWQVFSGTLRP
jgi:hypothetical protein